MEYCPIIVNKKPIMNWKPWLLPLLLSATALAFQYLPESSVSNTTIQGAGEVLQAYENQRSGLWVNVSGKVARILKDDNQGSRHQRFILRLDNGHTVLVSHNIDLAPRLPLREGDWPELRGRYEWNSQGGLIHWTHHDPKGQLSGGWITLKGRKYQ